MDLLDYVDYDKTIKLNHGHHLPLTYKEWSNWDLEHPPGENHHKFWILKVPVILHKLEY